MTIRYPCPKTRNPRSRALCEQVCSRETGSAVLIVIVLLSVMVALVLSNGVVLRQLEGELRLLDQKQQRKFEPPRTAAPATNAVPHVASPIPQSEREKAPKASDQP